MTAAPAVALAVLSAWVVTQLAFPFATLPFIRLTRAAVPRAVIGFGPKLFRFRIRETELEIKLLPLTAYLSPTGANPYADDEPPVPPAVAWPDAPVAPRVAVFVIVPRIAVLIVAVLLIGPSRALHAVVEGVPEIFAFVTSVGTRAILERGGSLYSREGFAVLLGVALCKLVAMGIVFLPADLAGACRTRATDARLDPKTQAKLRAVMLLAMWLLQVVWVVAWARWAFGG